MLPTNDATKRLTEFAQKLYDDHLDVADVQVFAANPWQSVVVLFNQKGQGDKYWVEHPSEDESTWTWVREHNGA